MGRQGCAKTTEDRPPAERDAMMLKRIMPYVSQVIFISFLLMLVSIGFYHRCAPDEERESREVRTASRKWDQPDRKAREEREGKANKSRKAQEQGEHNFNSGQYEAAIANFDVAIQHKNDDPRAYYLRGLAKAELSQYEAAISDYSMAIRLTPR